MVDDGMLLNFEIGSVFIKFYIKFKGGNWWDCKCVEKVVNVGFFKVSYDVLNDDVDLV